MRAQLELTSGQQEFIRWTAITIMVVDHVGATLLEPADAVPLRAIGRIAWPLLAFLLANPVARRGVNPARYVRPLATWYALSILPYALAFGILRPNSLATRLLAALLIQVIWSKDELDERSPALAPLALGLLLVAGFFVEYGPPGVLLPVSAWWALTTRRPLAWGATLLLVAAQNYPWALWLVALLAVRVPLLVACLPATIPRTGRLAWAFSWPATEVMAGHCLLRGSYPRFITGLRPGAE